MHMRSMFDGSTAILLFLGLSAGLGSPAKATTLTVSDVYLQYYNVGPNNLDFSSGEFVRYGASSAVPNGSGGTTGSASTTNATTGNPINRNIFWDTSPASPNFFSGLLPICTTTCTPTGNNNPANLTNPWTITFSNPSTTPTSVPNTLSLAGPGEIPFVNSVSLSGTATAPVFSWTPPAGLAVNGYRVNIYQNTLNNLSSGGNNSGEVTTANLQPGVTSYTVQPSDFHVPGTSLLPNTEYTIEISILQTRNGLSTNLSNNNVIAISRVYSNFQIVPNAPGPIQLPTTTLVGQQVIFGFNIPVTAGVLIST
jgi:hypothetical protein